MLVSTVAEIDGDAGMCGSASASSRALAWSSCRRFGPSSSAINPAAASTPAWRIPPPNALRKMRALRICSAEPTSMEPTGAPRPFDRQNITVSKPRVRVCTSTPSAMAALKMRAPSRCVGSFRSFTPPQISSKTVKGVQPVRRPDSRCFQSRSGRLPRGTSRRAESPARYASR